MFDRIAKQFLPMEWCFFPTVDRNVPKNTWEGIKDKYLFRGMVQDSIYDVSVLLLARRFHRQLRHDVVLWTTETTLKLDYIVFIENKGTREK